MELTLPLIIFSLVTGYLATIGVWRLYFSPLSSIPGPKWAALTRLGELYWSFFKGGRWMWKMEELHEKYGPIVRISPFEVHIKDSHFFSEVYESQKKAAKYGWFVQGSAAATSTLTSVPHDLHRQRRAALAPFFSARSVARLEPLIRAKVEKLAARLRGAAASGDVVRLDAAFIALTMDIISDYAFAVDGDDLLDDPDFRIVWLHTLQGSLQTVPIWMFFPWLLDVLRAIPLSIMDRISADAGFMLKWQAGVKELVTTIMQGRDRSSKLGEEGRSIFHKLRDHPDLSPEEKSLQRLCDEGEVITGAGSETTATTLVNVFFYLKHEPDILGRLRDELDRAMPDPAIIPTWAELQRLPYLSAVVKEGLRFQGGLTSRTPRIFDEDLRYKDVVIPAGTPISLTGFMVLNDPDIFPEPKRFRPERWLNGGERLEKFLVSFGKGSRQCMGMNLAYAELYLTIAAIVRRFDWDLHETTLDDVVIKHDFVIGLPSFDSKGVRAFIRPR